MKKIIVVLAMMFLCNIVNAQDILTEVVINGNTSYLDNLLAIEQINDFTLSELRILRNTIFAKYGYKFTSDDLTIHFSQFPWYEGTKTSVENELTLIDWKNVELIKILENYYPTKIDYVFNFRHNGIYILDNNFIVTPIYTYKDENNDAYWAGSYYDYIQLGDFLFFDKLGFSTHILFYDYKTKYFLDMGDKLYYNYIFSIFYQSRKTMVVNGLCYDTPVSVTINFPSDRFGDELIGTTFYVPEDIRAREFIYQGITILTNGSIENYFRHGYVDEYVKEHLFTAFDKNIIVLLENSYLWEEEGEIITRGIPEGLWVNIIYNNIYNVYFIMVIHNGWDWGSH